MRRRDSDSHSDSDSGSERDTSVWPQYYRRHLGTPAETRADPFGAAVLALTAALCLTALPLALFGLSGWLFAKAGLRAVRDRAQ